MTRPRKQTVDWFPHYTAHGQTMFILEQKYEDKGYSFWFKLLELLGASQGHFLHLETPASWEFLQAKTRTTRELCTEILDLLADLEAIDTALWREQNIIWSDNFVDGISAVYTNRKVEIPSRPSFYTQKPVSDGITTSRNPQRKEVEEGREGKKERPDAHMNEQTQTRKPESEIPLCERTQEERNAFADKMRDARINALREAGKKNGN